MQLLCATELYDTKSDLLIQNIIQSDYKILGILCYYYIGTYNMAQIYIM